MEFWRQVVGQTLEGLCSEDQFELVFAELHREFGSARRWRLVDDAIPTIETLKSRGYLVGILSNWDTRLRQVMSELGVMPLVDDCFISCEIGAEKPDLRIFQHVEREWDLWPENILHVGNSPGHDGEGARNAGWHYFLVGDTSGKAVGRHPGLTSLGSLLKHLPRR
jgi:putative hydrolase of the HAD superfamily